MGALARFAVPCVVGVGLMAAGVRAQSGATPKAGLVTREVAPAAHRNWRGSAEHTLHVTVWYPAADTAREIPQFLGPVDAPLFEAGLAAPHAAFAPSLTPYPLVLLSHGSGSAALQLAWLGTALARAGFVVAAVDHPGDSAAAAPTSEGRQLWWERATDLSEVLDGLLADPELGPHLDKERVGAAGYALGGYTVLELGGARSDVAAFYDLCRAKPGDTTCHGPERKADTTPASLLEAVRKTSGESLARSGDSFRDTRVRAVLAIAPALGFVLTPESLRAMRLPVALVAGSADEQVPAAANADRIRAGVRGARETVLPGVTHEAFLDTCTEAGRRSEAALCTDPPGVDRAAVHTQVEEMAVQFFRRALRER